MTHVLAGEDVTACNTIAYKIMGALRSASVSASFVLILDKSKSVR
jgi:hypothetical protein